MKFSIRAMFVLTTVAAVLIAIVFAFPPVLSAIGLLLAFPVMAAVSTSAAYYGRGWVRAFSVGTLAVMWSTTGMAWVLCLDFGIVLIAPDVEFGALVNNLGDSAEYFRAMAIIAALLTMPAGLTGVAMRWAMRPDAEESRSSTPGE